MKHKFEGISGRGEGGRDDGGGRREDGLDDGQDKAATPGQVWWLSVFGYLGVWVIWWLAAAEGGLFYHLGNAKCVTCGRAFYKTKNAISRARRCRFESSPTSTQKC